MKDRIEELARSMCKTDNLSSPSSEWFLTTDGLAKQAITLAVNEALELAAKECGAMVMYPGGRCEAPKHQDVWAAAEAIRKLKVKE